ncbi:hypothetical protein Tco_0821821 [Tanacetum coccineum]|uniref:Uncharacterized protein n=1 Tax=Tanacetum coccineum TaxID=301880 RepID=A0ABQ5AGB1_9ASTR
MGLPSILDEGTHASQPLPEGNVTSPKDLGGNIQPLDRDLTFTTSDEDIAKTTPCPKESRGDKDSGGNKLPTDMEPQNPTDADLSGTSVKYQEDQTQSSRLRYQSLTENEDEAQESKEDILGAGEEMDDNPQSAETQHQSPPPQEDKPTSPIAPHIDASDTDSSSDKILKKYDDTLPLTEQKLVKYLQKVSRVLFERLTKDQDQTDKLVEASTSSLEKSSTTINDLYKGLNVITDLLKNINTAVKDDPAANAKINEATETFGKIFSNVTEVLSLVKGFDFFALLSSVKLLQDHAFKQNEASTDWMKSSTNMAWNLGSRMTRVELS